MFKVTLSNGVSFSCAENQTLVDAAKANGLAIEHSCKSGQCGVCRADVIEGSTKAIVEEKAFSTDRVSSTSILTCCRAPASDISLDIEDLGEIGELKMLTLPARIDSLSRYETDVMEVVLRIPPKAGFKYLPGQYLNLIWNGVKRSYSIANAPGEDSKLRLLIKKVESGIMSSFLFVDAAVEDLVRIEGPLGTFSYRDRQEDTVVFMATGTGIAPVKAMLEGFSELLRTKRVYVVWGGRRKSDLFLEPDVTWKGAVYVPVLSRERIEGYFFGYVQDAVLNLGLDFKRTVIYACGSEKMIDDSKRIFLENGLLEGNFRSDAFVSSC